MAYTRPDHNAAHASWYGASAYTRPPAASTYGTWSVDSPDAGRLSDAGLPLAPRVVALHSAAGIVADSGLPLSPAVQAVLGHGAFVADSGLPLSPQIMGAHPRALLADGGLPLAPAAAARVSIGALAADTGPLGAPAAFGFTDFTARLASDTPTRYRGYLVTPGGTVEVPISSWQATLQTGSMCYAQCVVPAIHDLLPVLEAATDFFVTKLGVLIDGTPVQTEIVRCPIGAKRYDRGVTNYSASLTGYFSAYSEIADPDARYDRTLTGIRTTSVYDSGLRVRCNIDWLLRPSQRAWFMGAPMVVGFMNLYGMADDSYMDVGERRV